MKNNNKRTVSIHYIKSHVLPLEILTIDWHDFFKTFFVRRFLYFHGGNHLSGGLFEKLVECITANNEVFKWEAIFLVIIILPEIRICLINLNRIHVLSKLNVEVYSFSNWFRMICFQLIIWNDKTSKYRHFW